MTEVRFIACPNEMAVCALGHDPDQPAPAQWFFYRATSSGSGALALCTRHAIRECGAAWASEIAVTINGATYAPPAPFCIGPQVERCGHERMMATQDRLNEALIQRIDDTESELGAARAEIERLNAELHTYGQALLVAEAEIEGSLYD